MEIELSPSSPQGQANGLIKDTTTQTFVRDVIEESNTTPVLVDFWAPWCGPCKQLTPVLEKVVQQAAGRVKLVKLNIDENPEIPQQMRIQSIPAVFAFVSGRPVDGFMGALPESELKRFIDKIAGESGPSPLDEILDHARQAFDQGDFAAAGQICAQVLQEDPENPTAIAIMAKCFIEMGQLDKAQQTLEMAPANLTDADIDSARAALDLARQAGDAGDTQALRAQVETNPNDHQTRFELALALHAHGDRTQAVDQLLEIVRRDRKWNDEAARKQLLVFFDAYGPRDEATLYGRRQLSSLLFS